MISFENAARRFQSEEIDDLFDLIGKKKRTVQQYSWRYKKNVKFYSIHRFVDGNVLECAVSGPSTPDLRFSLQKDDRGYVFKMSVGKLNEATLATIAKVLYGLAGRLVPKKITGLDTSNWEGHYLWVEKLTEESVSIFDEAVDLSLMTEEFKDLCIAWGVSIRKYPKA